MNNECLQNVALYLPFYFIGKPLCKSIYEAHITHMKNQIIKLQRWYKKNMLPSHNCDAFDNNLLTKNTKIRLYRAKYPNENVTGAIKLFSIKAGNITVTNYVNNLIEPYTRRDLIYILNLCTKQEIDYVGW
jgi:hypothetical protein